MKLTTTQNQVITLKENIAGGGEARIWTVEEVAHQVAKIYHQPTPYHEEKLRAMQANAPQHSTIAWPIELLYQQQHFKGYLMPKVGGSKPIFNVYNPVQRRDLYPHFHWQYLHRTAFNLAIALQAVHERGHVVGDVNESNVLVNAQAIVTLVDTDSFQVTGQSGKIYRCTVGKPEYTPPELQGINLHQINRLPEHDLFGLGCLIFQLLMEGRHPFAGQLLDSRLWVERVDLYGIRQGLFPYHPNKVLGPNRHAPPFTVLHPEIQAAFLRCFVDGYKDPRQRPTPQTWQTVLAQAESTLQTCSHHPHHRYSSHVGHCHWCPAPAGASSRRQPVTPPQPVPQVLISRGQPSYLSPTWTLPPLPPSGPVPPPSQQINWQAGVGVAIGLFLFVLLSLFSRNTPDRLKTRPSIPTRSIVTSTPIKVVSTSTPVKPLATATPVKPVPTSAMIKIPPGKFMMGSTRDEVDTLISHCSNYQKCTQEQYEDSVPQYGVEMSMYWIDQFLVTQRQYNACVARQKCTPAGQQASWNYCRGAADLLDCPVTSVTWQQAQNYCKSLDKRLPTEAEWEKAARGPEGWIYPWGNSPPKQDFALLPEEVDALVQETLDKLNGQPSTPSPILIRAKDKVRQDWLYRNSISSYYSMMDVGGQAREWVSDYYDKNFYRYSALTNPENTDISPQRVVRGMSDFAVAKRGAKSPTETDFFIGFRCVRSQ